MGIDFCVTVVIAVFWLAGSSAWANSLNGLKNAADAGTWVTSSEIGGPCYSSDGHNPVLVYVASCGAIFKGSFGGANVSCILGFLNFFLCPATCGTCTRKLLGSTSPGLSRPRGQISMWNRHPPIELLTFVVSLICIVI